MTTVSNDEGIHKFEIKIIEWSKYKTKSPILMQNESSQCLLISLINLLILSHDQEYDEIILMIATHYDLIEKFRELLLNKEKEQGFISLYEIITHLTDIYWIFIDHYHDVFDSDNLVKSISKLHTRFSMDPNLTNGQFSWYETPSQICDVFDTEIHHGWCFGKDEAISNVIKVIGTTKYFRKTEPFGTFNEIQEYLLKDINDETSEEQKAIIEENKAIISSWFNNNKTQLTNIGLQNLNNYLDDSEFVIFFRNNNFSTLYKKSEMEFYLLVTDSSLKSNKIVWKSLNLVNDGDNLFFDGNFLPILDINN